MHILLFEGYFKVFGVFLLLFLGTQFGIQKSCLCKRNDKYQVCLSQTYRFDPLDALVSQNNAWVLMCVCVVCVCACVCVCVLSVLAYDCEHGKHDSDIEDVETGGV